jgi:carboxyl-terminal processing protease
MIRYMKGPAGTKVDILVNRDGEEVLFNITRDKIPVHSIDVSFMIDETTGYVKLAKFSRTTYSEFVKAVDDLREQGMQHLVFDLRGNSG